VTASFRFVHAADLHLDTPFEGVAGPAPDVARALQEASLQAWDNVVEVALERDASLLLIAGDVYDGAQRGLRAQLRFLGGLRRLSEAGVRTFIVHGNHDPLDGWSAIGEWPPGVHVFGSSGVGTARVDLEGGGVVCVHGISYATRETTENLARRFSRSGDAGVDEGDGHGPESAGAATLFSEPTGGSAGPAAAASTGAGGTLVARPAGERSAPTPDTRSAPTPTDRSAFHIGLLHANVGGSPEHGNYAPCSITDLQAAGMDYWALGHIHKRQVLREGAPWIAYSGDTQGRSPKPSETGAKGVFVGEVVRNSVSSLEFQPVDVVRFATCAVDVAEAADVPALQARVLAAIDRLRDEHTGRALLVRVELDGRGAVAADLRREGAIGDLLTELRDTCAGRSPFVWIESVKDRARSALDLEALRRRGDFSAELLELADELTAAAGGRVAFVDEAAAALTGSGKVAQALRETGAGDPPTEAATADVFDAALWTALDALEREAEE